MTEYSCHTAYNTVNEVIDNAFVRTNGVSAAIRNISKLVLFKGRSKISLTYFPFHSLDWQPVWAFSFPPSCLSVVCQCALLYWTSCVFIHHLCQAFPPTLDYSEDWFTSLKCYMSFHPLNSVHNGTHRKIPCQNFGSISILLDLNLILC